MGMTILGDKFGINTGPVGDGHGGTNYANGAGYTNSAGPMHGSVSATRQIQNYLTSVNGVANPRALYVISSGNNDLLHPPTPDPNFLNDSASALATSAATLQRAGARTILVPNSFLYAVYAQNGGGMDPANASAYAISASYNSLRWSDLTAAGVHFIPADLDSVFRYVVQNPTRFGFTPNSVLASSAQFYPGSPNDPAILDIVTPPRQQTDLFIDGHHLTTAGQTIEADYEYCLLTAPGEISLLAESAVQNGWAHAATIQGQLDPCGRYCRPCGRDIWTSIGTCSLAVNNAPGFAGDNGTPFGGTVGVDFQTQDGIIYGAAFTSGSQVPQFSTGGHFSQVDEAPSLYVGYLGGPLWGNAVITYDLFQYDIARSVPLGIFTDQNNASTTGQSFELALRGGWNLSMGQFICGPVAGLLLQQAHINGFTETGDTGVTALSFNDQTRNSLVTQLGWRVCVDGGRLRPFAEADWNHECAERDRTIAASLTTVGAPSYTMDAVPVVSDWATTSVGAYYDINSRVTLRGAASAMYVNPQMLSCGGEFSLNFGF
jgi:outer membrane lipase/esterase